jgi:hypothetical protein
VFLNYNFLKTQFTNGSFSAIRFKIALFVYEVAIPNTPLMYMVSESVFEYNSHLNLLHILHIGGPYLLRTNVKIVIKSREMLLLQHQHNMNTTPLHMG